MLEVNDAQLAETSAVMLPGVGTPVHAGPWIVAL
jgi:hypothetical protein